jgi:hypothetical protein
LPVKNNEDASNKGSSSHDRATFQHAAGSTSTENFIYKPPKTYHASALVLSTLPTLENDGEVNHASVGSVQAEVCKQEK